MLDEDFLGAFKADRDVYLKQAVAGIVGKCALKGTVHETRALLFDYDSWLDATDQPVGYLDAELAAFAKHYSAHFERISPGDGGWFDSLRSE